VREEESAIVITAASSLLVFLLTLLTLKRVPECAGMAFIECLINNPAVFIREFCRFEALLIIPLVISAKYLFRYYKIERVIPAIISGLGAGISSGLSVMEALEMVCVRAYEPVSSVLKEFIWRTRMGADVSEELKNLNKRIRHPYMPFLVITLSNVLLEPFRAPAIVKSITEALFAYDKNVKRLRSELGIYKVIVGVIIVTFSIIFSILYKLIGSIITELPTGPALSALDINMLVLINFFAIIFFSIMSAIYVTKITKSPSLAAIPTAIAYLLASTIAYYIAYVYI